MPGALVRVKGLTEVNREFQLNFAVMKTNTSVGLTDRDLDELGARFYQMNDSNTNPSSNLYLAKTDPPAAMRPVSTILWSIMGWLRLMSRAVVFTEVYVSDGKKNSGQAVPENTFYTFNCQVGGLRNVPTPAASVLTLQINRIPAVNSRKRGRLYMRTVLAQNEVNQNDSDGASFQNSTIRDFYESLLTTTLNTSNFSQHWSPALTDGGWAHALPRRLYISGDPNNNPLTEFVPISSYEVRGVTPRQNKRGRRRRGVGGLSFGSALQQGLSPEKLTSLIEVAAQQERVRQELEYHKQIARVQKQLDALQKQLVRAQAVNGDAAAAERFEIPEALSDYLEEDDEE